MRTMHHMTERLSSLGPGEEYVPVEYVFMWYEDGEDRIFQSRVPAELYDFNTFTLEGLDGVLVPKEYYRTAYVTCWTRFEGVLEDHHFLKKSSLSIYDPRDKEEDWPARELHDEINIYEKLKIHPHPNIVRYYGVQVDDEGYIVDIVLEKFDARIDQALVAPRKPGHIADVDVVMKDLHSAVEHLHSIGIGHCDIAPSNIGIDGNGKAILFDFDAAFPVGARRYGKIANGSFDDPPEIVEAEIACVEIDHAGLMLTREALLNISRVRGLIPEDHVDIEPA